MRLLELTLSILTIVSSIAMLFPRISNKVKYQILPILLILTGIIQLWFEGFRWQLWPIFIAVLLLVLVAIRRLTNLHLINKPTRIIIIVLILTTVSIAAGFLLPIPQPYKITGPYQVGTTIFPLVDTSREEIYAVQPNNPREIMVQVWYPANPAELNQQAQWMPEIEIAGPAISEWISLPTFALDHLKYAKSHAFLDAPIVGNGERFPVLVFSHGWSGFKEQNIYQMEELASHGYVLVGINHTYGAVITVFPDGRQLHRNDAALPDGVSEEEYQHASNQLVRQWAGDIGFILDELDLLDKSENSHPFAGSLDLDRVGILGHSTGGGAAAEFCGTDSRCKAALMMDLWIEPVSSAVVSVGLSQPYLLLHSATWADQDNHSNNFALTGDLVNASSGEAIEIRIEGTEHYDFTSLPLLTPLASAIGLKGPIPGDSGLELINYYTVAFFNQSLLGVDENLLKRENSPFAAADFISRP